MAIIGTTLRSPDWMKLTVDSYRFSLVGALRVISLGVNEEF